MAYLFDYWDFVRFDINIISNKVTLLKITENYI